MTARRNQDGELEVVKLGGQTITFRMLLVLLLIANTPLGDRIWKPLGLSQEQNNDAVIRKLNKLEDQIIDLNFDFRRLTAQLEQMKKNKPL